MADKVNIVKLAIDAYNGRVQGNYSTGESMEVLRKALVDANNGSTKLDFKAIRDGKCNGLFTIIEEILELTIVDAVTANPFFENMVEYRNLALGDTNEFIIEDNSLFIVSDTAEGTQGVRRQRLNAGDKVTIDTVLKTVKIYEELNRVLSGAIDFNKFIDRVAESFRQKTFEDIYNAFHDITQSTLGATYFPTAGSYSESALLDVIAHVEAATGKEVTLVGTKKALRRLKMTDIAETAKTDLYDIGYFGKFYGTPAVALKQVHKRGTDNFLLDDNRIYVIPTGIKPIKFVTEGDSLVIMGNPLDNADLSQEYLYGSRYGVATIINEKFGIYDMV